MAPPRCSLLRLRGRTRPQRSPRPPSIGRGASGARWRLRAPAQPPAPARHLRQRRRHRPPVRRLRLQHWAATSHRSSPACLGLPPARLSVRDRAPCRYSIDLSLRPHSMAARCAPVHVWQRREARSLARARLFDSIRRARAVSTSASHGPRRAAVHYRVTTCYWPGTVTRYGST